MSCPRWKVRPAMEHQLSPGTINSESESVRLEAVEARISAPILHGPATETDGFDGGAPTASLEEPSAGWGAPPLASDLGDRLLRVDLDRRLRRGLAVAATAVVATLILSGGDIRAAMGGGLAVVIFVATWILGGRVTFSFGQGVVGYRGDMGWPTGVQEDDDFHWNWRPGDAHSDEDP
ncbi:MAG: hypothetical protein ACJ77C_00685 [Chloroflexota bacterium]